MTKPLWFGKKDSAAKNLSDYNSSGLGYCFLRVLDKVIAGSLTFNKNLYQPPADILGSFEL